MLQPAAHQRPAQPTADSTRERLLRCAAGLFAERGYARTSIRDIADAADANVASISYHFGDKAGLYRALMDATMPLAVPAADGDRSLSLAETLRLFYSGFVEPLNDGERARQCIRLHMREMLEPSGVWATGPLHGIEPAHAALVRALCRELAVERADDDLQRLAICIAALGVHLHAGRDITDRLAPRLNANAAAIAVWLDRLVAFAEGMVAVEARRRAGVEDPPTGPQP